MSGFFGCISKNDCVAEVFYGTDYHSHLGTKRAGLAFCDNGKFTRSIHSIENAYFRNKFEDDLHKFKGSTIGIGIISDLQAQPITITSKTGRFSIATIGKIDNKDELIKEMLENNLHFAEMSDSSINPTELVAVIIGRANSLEQGIADAKEKIKGSCSMLIMTEDAIYAVRDKLGRTPIVLARGVSSHAVAFESSAFNNLGFERVRDLGPSETIKMTVDNIEVIHAPQKKCQICSFLWVYYGYPSSYFEGINVEDSRYKCGKALSLRDDSIDADFVSGIPDSGIGHAIGYSNGKCIPYKRAFVKYTPTWPRSFMPQNQDMRDLVAKMKLIPNKDFVKDKNIVFLDDSIVRGTQLKDNVVKLYEIGVKNVHIRIACPPLVYPCSFLNFSNSRSSYDLITRRVIRDLENSDCVTDDILKEYVDENSERHQAMIDEMRRRIGVTSLKFQKLNDLITSIGLPKEQVCTHCFDNSSYFE